MEPEGENKTEQTTHCFWGRNLAIGRSNGQSHENQTMIDNSRNKPDPKVEKGRGEDYSGMLTRSRLSRRGLRKLAFVQTLLLIAFLGHIKCEVVDNQRSSDDAVRSSGSTHHDGELKILDEDGGALEVYHEDIPDDNDRTRDSNDRTGTGGKDDLIVVVAVDGTLAGISKKTGKILWKQTETPQSSTQKSDIDAMKPVKPKSISLLQPLISTTTTTKSAATSDYGAVPSVDGNVYMTVSKDPVTTSIKELVHRAPFLDHRGRFYVGSRHATAAALDGATGEILRTMSASNTNNDEHPPLASSPLTKDAVWIGRVDYSVKVQNARTGMTDVEFSIAEVMSVTDMTDPAKQEGHAWTGRHSDSLSLPAAADPFSLSIPSTLLATPSGNLAYRNPESGDLEWVSNESFDTPIAYAMDAASGLTLGVDIIPDVPVPEHSSLEYLSREMERQLYLLNEGRQEDDGDDHPNTIFGAIKSSGQLYALPLGRRRTVAGAKAIQPHATAIASGKHNTHIKQITTGRTTLQQHHGHDQYPKPCNPSTPDYPGCLVPQRLESYFTGTGDGRQTVPLSDEEDALTVLPSSESAATTMDEQYPPQDMIYHPEFGYISYHDFQLLQQPRRSKSQKYMRILGSWLPPTIALIFVLSFELGRRKRLTDNQKKDIASAGEEVAKQSTQPIALLSQEQQQRLSLPPEQQHVIQVSDQVLGYGGQGTVVYKGVLDGRDVAVKRMLQTYHANADREISLLIESDGHPNVVRYFLKEVRGDFVYLALELCDLSLHDLIGVLKAGTPQNTLFPTKTILLQIASGVKHLHSLRIVHRDLKPANILLAISQKGKKVGTQEDTVEDRFERGQYVAKISDMGLGKQLVGQSSLGASMVAESSFRGAGKSGATSVGVGPGSVGWQAPEVMALRMAASDASARSGESNNGVLAESSPNDTSTKNPRTSRSVDIFSLGCIFFSTLVPGFHPFGDWFEREANIMHNRPRIEVLQKLSADAFDLVRAMLQRNAKLRPTAKQICEHPFFWTAQKKQTFLCDFSDRIETDACSESTSQVVNALTIEKGATEVVSHSWDKRLDEALIDNMQRFRSYDPSAVRDLLRLIRNKHHHFDELSTEFREASNVNNQDDLFLYFETRFPNLLMHCYNYCRLILNEDDPLTTKYNIPPFPKSDLRQAISPTPESVIVSQQQGDEELEQDETPEEKSSEESGEDASWEKLPEKRQSPENQTSTIPPLMESSVAGTEDIIVWEGSTAAKTFNCRGWARSEEEWSTRIDSWFRKKDPNLKRAAEDTKFRTRLCNHWDESLGTFCPMRKKNKCVFAHGPVELRVKEAKRNRWGKLVDKNGNNSNPRHSGGEDTYGAARSIETVRKVEGKWNTGKMQGASKGKKQTPGKKKKDT